MKYIPVRDDGAFKTVEIIRGVMRQSGNPQKGIDFEEMCKRVRILDVLDKFKSDGISLEDADHTFLVQSIRAFPFAMADAELLAILREIMDAKAPDS